MSWLDDLFWGTTNFFCPQGQLPEYDPLKPWQWKCSPVPTGSSIAKPVAGKCPTGSVYVANLNGIGKPGCASVWKGTEAPPIMKATKDFWLPMIVGNGVDSGAPNWTPYAVGAAAVIVALVVFKKVRK